MEKYTKINGKKEFSNTYYTNSNINIVLKLKLIWW